MTEEPEACAACGHYHVYHFVVGRPCRAWNPDTADFGCGCPGWAAPALASLVVSNRLTYESDRLQ